MENYRQKLRMSNVISDAVPLQQRLPEPDTALVDVDIRLNENEAGSPQFQTPEESSSGGSENENENDMNMDASPPGPGIGVGAEATYLTLDKSSKEGDYELGHPQVQKMDESKNMLALL